MSSSNVTYNYAVPDECWINDFSSNLTMEFEYIGPEELIVTIPRPCGSAYAQALAGPVYDYEFQLTMNVTANPELLPYADLLWERPDGLEVETEERTDSYGFTYTEVTNRTIHDYYWKPTYDIEAEEWRPLKVIEKDTLTPKMRAYVSKADMFVGILERFQFNDADQAILDAYKVELAQYKALVTTPWKYPGVNPWDAIAPKIPMELIVKMNQIKDSGLANSDGLDLLTQ